ncbi:hypothetical protein N1851_031568 [Merluccius polli]|uniref:Uncharacterized protein n=1 Tax=Merluccius polli TaxID=89951 RepID=A0AA47M3Y5_MERPO|nr:hypothetical protein N1851_031568 [Merluccius polli]
MSLHDFLRDGGEAPHRIMNRLSQLIQNLDIAGLAPTFPFSPSSRKNSWRDWDDQIFMETSGGTDRALEVGREESGMGGEEMTGSSGVLTEEEEDQDEEEEEEGGLGTEGL